MTSRGTFQPFFSMILWDVVCMGIEGRRQNPFVHLLTHNQECFGCHWILICSYFALAFLVKSFIGFSSHLSVGVFCSCSICRPNEIDGFLELDTFIWHWKYSISSSNTPALKLYCIWAWAFGCWHLPHGSFPILLTPLHCFQKVGYDNKQSIREPYLFNGTQQRSWKPCHHQRMLVKILLNPFWHVLIQMLACRWLYLSKGESFSTSSLRVSFILVLTKRSIIF